jgi:hypothetical protein
VRRAARGDRMRSASSSGRSTSSCSSRRISSWSRQCCVGFAIGRSGAGEASAREPGKPLRGRNDSRQEFVHPPDSHTGSHFRSSHQFDGRRVDRRISPSTSGEREQ